MKGLIILLLGLVVAGCDPIRDEQGNIKVMDTDSGRFEVKSHGVFNAGYCNNKREILVVKDVETGVCYLAVTGCGTTELHTKQEGKANHIREE